MKGEKGFTLIELLVVVAILGVLAAVIIPNVSHFVGRESGERNSELNLVRDAVNEMEGLEATNDMSIFPPGNPLYPKYVKERYTKFNYRLEYDKYHIRQEK